MAPPIVEIDNGGSTPGFSLFNSGTAFIDPIFRTWIGEDGFYFIQQVYNPNKKALNYEIVFCADFLGHQISLDVMRSGNGFRSYFFKNNLFLALSAVENERGIYKTPETSPYIYEGNLLSEQEFKPKIAPLFTSLDRNIVFPKLYSSFGLDDACRIYKANNNFYRLETDTANYYFDFSDPAYVCKIECYRDDDLVMQIVYHGDYNLSVICFSKIADKDLIVRSNRTGAEDITIEYIVVDGDKAYLYNPVINLKDAKLEAPEAETDTLKNKTEELQ